MSLMRQSLRRIAEKVHCGREQLPERAIVGQLPKLPSLPGQSSIEDAGQQFGIRRRSSYIEKPIQGELCKSMMAPPRITAAEN